MKKFIPLLFSIVFITTSYTVSAQKDNEKEINIETMLNCKVCEEAIYEALESIEGIEYFALDFDAHVIGVKYNTLIISEKAIKNAILEMGLPVDGIEGDEDAYLELPDCCKKVLDQSGKRGEEIDPENTIEENEIIIEEEKEKKKKKKKSNEGGDDSSWD